MPRDITHIILADEAAEIIKSNEIFDNINAFHMGCVSDDSFLYTLSPQLSTRLHGGLGDDTRAVVLDMLDRIRGEKNQARVAEQKAFTYGYLCHMATDFTFHPLIYSISGSQLKSNNISISDVDLSKACHRYAETWLDLHLMREKNLSFKNFRPFRKIVTNMAMRIRLDDFFTDCFQSALKAKKYTWGDNFDLQSQFHNGMTRQFFVDKITTNQTIAEMLRKLDRVLNGKLKLYISGFYDLNGDIPQRLTAGSFVHPVTGEIIKKSIKDLEQDSIKYSVKFINAATDYIKSGDREAFLKAVPNVNLDTGILRSKLSDIRKRITHEDLKSVEIESKSNAKTSFLINIWQRFDKKKQKQ
ncbi:MAG: zinc dependent phospholipase C family protein [Alphaproteobacteria bacterium]|nr:zinc dependent phospholipase C family protein [Alphaproteobacteria bacterium]